METQNMEVITETSGSYGSGSYGSTTYRTMNDAIRFDGRYVSLKYRIYKYTNYEIK